MKTVSLKIDDAIFVETERILDRIKIPRNRYINEALTHYNKIQRRLALEKNITRDSALVRQESMKVLSEFENLEDVD